jgi:hypothetical protein
LTPDVVNMDVFAATVRQHHIGTLTFRDHPAVV